MINRVKRQDRRRAIIAGIALLLSVIFFAAGIPNALAASNVSVTRQFNPSANAASSGGDGDGFQTNPTYAYADAGSGSAVDTNSGIADNGVATGTGTDKHNYFDYSISSIPTGSTINGITVRVDMAVDATTNSPFTAIRLSWDGGTSWTTESQQTLSATAETTYTYGGSGNTWGRTWSVSELSNSNFRVQVINGDTNGSNSNRDFSLDWLPVSITFTAPWDSYSDSGHTTISDNFTTFGSTAYLNGTGYLTGSYNVAYYDAGANGGLKTATDSSISVAGDGILNSQYLLNTTNNASSGSWHALVQSTSNGTTFPSNYNTAIGTPDLYGILANDSFLVQNDAIPEFPSPLAAGMVGVMCFCFYYFARHRQLAYVQA